MSLDVIQLTMDHPMVVDRAHPLPKCRACNKHFLVGEYIVLMELGPGGDYEARQRKREGRPYTAITISIHYACHTGYDYPPESKGLFP